MTSRAYRKWNYKRFWWRPGRTHSKHTRTRRECHFHVIFCTTSLCRTKEIQLFRQSFLLWRRRRLSDCAILHEMNTSRPFNWESERASARETDGTTANNMTVLCTHRKPFSCSSISSEFFVVDYPMNWARWAERRVEAGETAAIHTTHTGTHNQSDVTRARF